MNESSDTNTSFSLDEIRRQLAALGYENVGAERLEQFQSDLSRLMSRSGGGDTSINTTDTPYHHQFALDTVILRQFYLFWDLYKKKLD